MKNNNLCCFLLTLIMSLVGLTGISQVITAKSVLIPRADREICDAPYGLEVYGDENGVNLSWESVDYDHVIRWDDGEYSGISVGNNAHLMFDAAARWEVGQLADYNGDTIAQIAFFPTEATATYRARVWIGSGAVNMILDQLVVDPLIDDWNYITLAYPIIIDASVELWVGYYVDTPTAYPAGVDDGPAIDGFGNMLNLGGWHTLLQNNPEMNYNWNIAAVLHPNLSGKQVKYAIYRSDETMPYFLRAYTDQNYYLDDSVCQSLPLYYNYKVNALFLYGTDTCVSDFSNVVEENCVGINENKDEPDICIYPNPASDLIRIESPVTLQLVTIYDVHGSMILRKSISNKSIEIEVKDLPPGLYLLMFQTDNQLIFKKILGII